MTIPVTLTGPVVARATVTGSDDWYYVRATATVDGKRKVDGPRTRARTGVSGRVWVDLPDDANVTGVTVTAWAVEPSTTTPTVTVEQAYAAPRNPWKPGSRPRTAAGKLLTVQPNPRVTERRPVDALVARRLDELQAVLDWAARWGENVVITEAGVEGAGDDNSHAWQQLLDQYLDRCDLAGVPVLRWSEGIGAPLSFYRTGYAQGATSPIVGPGADGNAATLWERHLGVTPGRGMGVSLFSQCQAGKDFDADHPDVTVVKAENPSSLTYLASRGHTLIRQPYRWDRVERSPDGPLDPQRWPLVRANVDAAIAAGMCVVIDPHCSYGYRFAGESKDDSSRVFDGLTPEQYIAHLRRVCDDLDAAGYHGRYALELTNEPHGVGQSSWTADETSQRVVDALRADGNDTHLLIPSYPYDAALDLPDTVPWIDDPFGPRFHSYVVHHYFDAQRSGFYAWPPYATLLDRSQSEEES